MSVLTLPCDNCGTAIPADVHSEELGFCLPCSNKFWEHKPMEGGDCEHMALIATGEQFFSDYLDCWLEPVACVDCKVEFEMEV